MRDVIAAEKVIIDWCLDKVGNPYVFGAQGQKCTVSLRQEKSKDYPDYAAKIKQYCQRMKGGSTCNGCQWLRKDGTIPLAYDCEGLVKKALYEVGLELPSGATTQYNTKNWQLEQGTIDKMPKDRLCIVYRAEGNKKAHTGVWLGSDVGVVVHARGHENGVIKQTLEEYGRWTHYALPNLPENFQKEDKPVLYKAYVTSQTSKLNLRSMPSSSGIRILQIPPQDEIEVLEETNEEWVKVNYENKIGYVMKKFITKIQSGSGSSGSGSSSSSTPAAQPTKKTYYVKIEVDSETEAKALVALLKKASVGEE